MDICLFCDRRSRVFWSSGADLVAYFAVDYCVKLWFVCFRLGGGGCSSADLDHLLGSDLFVLIVTFFFWLRSVVSSVLLNGISLSC